MSSSYVKDNGNIMGGHIHQFECSSCRYTLTTDHRRESLLFCFHCGVKFGPEPKEEPTEGEWYALGNTVYARRSYGYSTDSEVAEVFSKSPPEQQRANVNLLAASKKLLFNLKVLTNERFPTNDQLVTAEKAIAEAEKGKG